MTHKQAERSAYYLREALKIGREARDSFDRQEYERVVRKTHEAVELWLKGRLLESGIEPAKIHDLNELNRKLKPPSPLPEDGLQYLTSERIPSFYGAEDIIPDQAYLKEDGDLCLDLLSLIGA